MDGCYVGEIISMFVCFLVCSRHPPLDISCCSKRFPLLVSVVVLQWLAPRARFVDGGFSRSPSSFSHGSCARDRSCHVPSCRPPTGCLVRPCLNPPLVGVMLIRYISTVYIRCSDSLSSPAGPMIGWLVSGWVLIGWCDAVWPTMRTVGAGLMPSLWTAGRTLCCVWG